MNKASPSVHERWRQIVARQQSSGLSVAEFCRQEHLAVSSCFTWKRRLEREGASNAASAFVRLRPGSAGPAEDSPRGWDGSIELHLGRGPGRGRRLVLRPGFDPRTLAAALAVLEDASSIREDR